MATLATSHRSYSPQRLFYTTALWAFAQAAIMVFAFFKGGHWMSATLEVLKLAILGTIVWKSVKAQDEAVWRMGALAALLSALTDLAFFLHRA